MDQAADANTGLTSIETTSGTVFETADWISNGLLVGVVRSNLGTGT